MKKSIFILFLLVSTISSLSADKLLKAEAKAFCFKGDIVFNIKSSSLDLTEDALQDNLGGYVDIPADKYYLKAGKKLYYLKGVVEVDYENKTNSFIAYIKNDSEKFINLKELHALKNSDDIKFIQKIDLQKNNKANSFSKNITTTNILNIFFEKELFEIEYKKCNAVF